MKCFSLFLFLMLSTVTVPAQSASQLEKEKAELLRIHKADREAHFKTDVDLLQQHSPDEFISVSQGKIYRSNKADERKQFTDYFQHAKYYEWDDMDEPIIRVSNDGSMAWMITRIRVRRTQKNAAGAEPETKFIYAGIMTYEKRDGKWIRVANVSTFEPLK
jgi:hypothetical protein